MKERTGVQMGIVVAVVAGVATCAGLAAEWWVSVGPVLRGDMDISVSGSSYVQWLGLHAAEPSREDPSGVGDPNRYADRDYDDGFVNMDPNTENDGLTWYWGYERDGQYSAAGDTLSFHGGGGTRVYRDTLLDTGLEDREEAEGAGVRFVAGRVLPCPKLRDALGVMAELCVGAEGVWGVGGRFKGTTYRERITKERYEIRDTYDLEGVIPPPAPYEGTYFGPGPLIENIPSSRSQHVNSRETWEAENYVDLDVEADIYRFWVGPRVSVQPFGRAVLYIIPNVSATLVDLDADRSEQFVAMYSDGRTETLEDWRDSVRESEWAVGFGAVAGVEIAFARTWRLGVFGGYDWVDDAAQVRVGPNLVEVDPSGYTAGIEVGKRF